MKRLKIDEEFMEWLLDLMAMDISSIVGKMSEKDFKFNVEFSTQLMNRQRISSENRKIYKHSLFKDEGFLKIKYNCRDDSRIYFRSMTNYLNMILLNDNFIVFVRYNYKNDEVEYFTFNEINEILTETLINDMIFVFKFLSEQYKFIN